MNSRTTAIGVFNHPLIRAIIENDIAKASEVNRLIVEEVMAEAMSGLYQSARSGIYRDFKKVKDSDNYEKFINKYAGDPPYKRFGDLSPKEQENYRGVVSRHLQVARESVKIDDTLDKATDQQQIAQAKKAKKELEDAEQKLEAEAEQDKQQPAAEEGPETAIGSAMFGESPDQKKLLLMFCAGKAIGECGKDDLPGDLDKASKLYNLFAKDLYSSAARPLDATGELARVAPSVGAGDAVVIATTTQPLDRERFQALMQVIKTWKEKGLAFPQGPETKQDHTWNFFERNGFAKDEDTKQSQAEMILDDDVAVVKKWLTGNLPAGMAAPPESEAALLGDIYKAFNLSDADQKRFAARVWPRLKEEGVIVDIKDRPGVVQIVRVGSGAGDEVPAATSSEEEGEAQEQDPLQAVRDVLDTFKTVEDYETRRQSELSPIVEPLTTPQRKQARELIAQKAHALRAAAEAEQQQAASAEEPAADPVPAPEEKPVQPTDPAPAEVETAVDNAAEDVAAGKDTEQASIEAAGEITPTATPEEKKELADKIKTEIGKKVAAAKTSADTEAVANEEQLEPLLAAYSNFENEFMDVPTLREQGNILVALMKALTEFEKTAEISAMSESANSDMEKIDAETKVDLRKSVEGIKRNMSSVLSALKQYKSKMFDINSNDIKKVVVSALNNIQDELKRAYDALECEVRRDCNMDAHKLTEQVTDESISQVRKAYNTILSAVSEFYNEAQKGTYKVSFRDSTFAKARKAIKGIQDYFPQISPFSTGQSIDQITPQLSKVFMKLRPVMDEFLALSKETAAPRDTINKFMERTKEVSLEINNLFGAETEIPAVEKEIEAEPAASEETEEETSQSKAPEEEPEASPPEALVEPMDDFLDDEAPAEEEEEEEEEAPDQEEGSEEAEEEEYNFGWVDELDIDEDYKKIIKGGPLRSAIRQARDGTLTEAMPKLSTLRAKAKGMVPSKFSFLAKTLDKFEIGEYKPKTLLKALKRKDPKYVIALNLIPKGELEGYLKNWVGLKLRIQPKDIQTLAGWKKYTAYLDKQKDLLGLPKEAPAQAIKLLYNFLKTNKEDIKFKEGFYPGAADPYDIKDIKYDENKDEITLFFGSVDEPVRINRTAFGVGRLIDAKDDSLQEQITKLLTPMIREQIRGKNG